VAGARRLSAVVRQRCPSCFEGHVFRSTFGVLPACQLCGHRLEPDTRVRRRLRLEATAAAAVCSVVVAAAAWRWLAPSYGLRFAALAAAFSWLVLLPGIVRYARVIRAHAEVAALERAHR
jgi:uncharacterized protein (DUF983 family)